MACGASWMMAAPLLAEPPALQQQIARQAVFIGSSRSNAIRLASDDQRASSATGKSLRWSDPVRAGKPLTDQNVLRWESRAVDPPPRTADARRPGRVSAPAAPAADWRSELPLEPRGSSAPPASPESDPFDDPFGDREPAGAERRSAPASKPPAARLATPSSRATGKSDPWNDVFDDSARSRPLAPTPATRPAHTAQSAQPAPTLPRSSDSETPRDLAPGPASSSPDAAPAPTPGVLDEDEAVESQPQNQKQDQHQNQLRGLDDYYRHPRARHDPANAPFAGRDCAAEQAQCLQLTMTSMRDISLDVSPRFTPNVEYDPQFEADEIGKRLAQAPSRIWLNRNGERLAEGRLIDLTRGQAHVERTDGQVVQIPMYELGDEDFCFVSAWWKIPLDCRLEMEQRDPRTWMPLTMTWTAPGLNNKPLYFQQVQLERYGHSAGPILQPVLSGAHFFASLAALPYAAGIHPPWECQYDLGYYRPGSCAPWVRPPLPISLRGALLQAGVVAGGVALIP